MKILLIDNGTTLLSKLEKLISETEIVHTWKDFSEKDVLWADIIVLSGGSLMQLKGNEQEFEKEIQLIKETTKPVVGICFGCELVVEAFGGTLKKLSVPHKGNRTITLVSPSKEITVFENHQWIIDSIPEGFEILAFSEQGPEMIKHASRPIYGMQFHPENHVDQTEGDELFRHVLQELS